MHAPVVDIGGISILYVLADIKHMNMTSFDAKMALFNRLIVKFSSRCQRVPRITMNL